MLVLLRDGKIAEDNKKNEEIIDAERQLKNVTGNKLDGNLPALPEKNHYGKGCRQGWHKPATKQRFARAHAAAAVEDAKVPHQHCDREKVEDDPEIDQV